SRRRPAPARSCPVAPWPWTSLPRRASLQGVRSGRRLGAADRLPSRRRLSSRLARCARLFGPGRRLAAERLHVLVERLDPGHQRMDLLARGYAQPGQRARHAVFEDLFELVPRVRRLLRDVARRLRDLAGYLADLLFGHGPRATLDAGAFLDQGFEDLAAFLLGLGERAEPGQPDLLGGITDCRRELAAVRLRFGHRLEFLDHDASPVVRGVGARPARWGGDGT